MKLSDHYVLIEPVEEPPKEGFQLVSVQDSFVYKGKVIALPGHPVFMGNDHVLVGDVVLFAKYSPDTQEVDLEGKKVKFLKATDILAVL